jgi:hypothetical protein
MKNYRVTVDFYFCAWAPGHAKNVLSRFLTRLTSKGYEARGGQLLFYDIHMSEPPQEVSDEEINELRADLDDYS